MYSPADMYYYLELDPKERRMLREFNSGYQRSFRRIQFYGSC
jgi:hypothetical protein